MSYFIFDNKRVYYNVKGNGSPLLFLHGNTMSSRMFATVINKYNKSFKTIRIDFPGHGKSAQLKQFETDFWYYNSKICYALLKHLEIEKAAVVGTSGGALVGINLCLEHPEVTHCLIADSFEGELPLKSYIESIEEDRRKDKKKIIAQLIWLYMHGFSWRQIVDADTKVNADFYNSGKSFFHKSIAELNVPTLLTGSMQDEYCDHLDDIYAQLKLKNEHLKIHLFESGRHPAMISNGKEFFQVVNEFIKTNNHENQ